MIKRYFFAGICFCLFAIVYWHTHSSNSNPPSIKPSSYTLLIYANNIENIKKPLFQSLYQQSEALDRIIFIDDGSNDRTYQAAQEACKILPMQIIRHEEKKGFLKSIYPIIHSCRDDEVVILLDNQSYFSHRNVFKEVKKQYESQDIWLSYFQNKNSYCKNISAKTLFSASMKKKKWKETHLKTFYASIFKQLRLNDLFFRGQMIDTDSCYFFPMMEMAAGHSYFHEKAGVISLDKPFAFFSKNYMHSQRYLARRPVYTPISSPLVSSSLKQTDLLIFSFDRPLQLYALLESTAQYVKNLNKISVIYRTSSHRFSKAYEKVIRTFDHVHFHKQSEKPSMDFQPLVMKAIFSNESAFIIFAVDDLVFKDDVDVQNCIDAMNATNAHSFSLRLGTHLHYCYMGDFSESTPNYVHINDRVIGWQINAAQGDWFYPNSVDLTMFKKEDIKPIFETIHFSNPNQLEISWNKKQIDLKKKTALSFIESKAVNIPLNIVNLAENNKNLNLYNPETLLNKFEQGLKMDISPLYKIKNISVHMEYDPVFITRDL